MLLSIVGIISMFIGAFYLNLSPANANFFIGGMVSILGCILLIKTVFYGNVSNTPTTINAVDNIDLSCYWDDKLRQNKKQLQLRLNNLNRSKLTAKNY